MTDVKKEEQVVVTWLKSHGYYKVVTEPSHTVIEADGKIRRMIIGIKTPDFDNNNIENIKNIASKKNREAWLATVEPDDNDITWSVLK